MTTSSSLQCFRVGGSVRDELMGLPAGDHDWVVVGATPERMIALGFRPVGKDFPVFLHPQTHEEYALARTERKTGPGYKGFAVHFAPDVTLEDDLLRRDLTINAMAVPAPDEHAGHQHTRQHLIDPFNGLQDLRDRIFRHVSPAFREDPVRILRLARFAARFPDFSVADETLALMRTMSAAGEVDALVPERVWQEISRGLMSARPSRMLQVLDDSHALGMLLPPLSPVAARPAWLAALDSSASAGDPLPVRFAILLAGAVDDRPANADDTRITPSAPATQATARAHDAHDQDAADTAPQHGTAAPVPTHAPQHAATLIERLARRLRASNECIDAARRLASETPGPIPDAARQWLAHPDRQSASGLLSLFNRHDAWRRPERLEHLLLAIRRLADADAGLDRIRHALAAARTVDTGTIARQHTNDPQAIRRAIDEARAAAITGFLTER